MTTRSESLTAEQAAIRSAAIAAANEVRIRGLAKTAELLATRPLDEVVDAICPNGTPAEREATKAELEARRARRRAEATAQSAA